MLQFTLYLALAAVALWLLWPMLTEPARRRWRLMRRPAAEPADKLADTLFVTWTNHGKEPGLIQPKG